MQATNDSNDTLTIEWLGHATFLLSSGDTCLLLDPVIPDMGYTLPAFDDLTAVLVTHLHRDHNYIDAAPEQTLKLIGLDPTGHFQPMKQQVGSASVRNVPAFHDNVGGQQRGEDAIWIVEMAGLRVVHMGDFGQSELSDEQVAAIGQPDVLLIPVGGTYTVDGTQAKHIIAQLQPHIVIPMHYRTAVIPTQSPLVGIEGFLGSAPPADAPHIITLRAADLEGVQGRVQVMSYEAGAVD